MAERSPVSFRPSTRTTLSREVWPRTTLTRRAAALARRLVALGARDYAHLDLTHAPEGKRPTRDVIDGLVRASRAFARGSD